MGKSAAYPWGRTPTPPIPPAGPPWAGATPNKLAALAVALHEDPHAIKRLRRLAGQDGAQVWAPGGPSSSRGARRRGLGVGGVWVASVLLPFRQTLLGVVEEVGYGVNWTALVAHAGVAACAS